MLKFMFLNKSKTAEGGLYIWNTKRPDFIARMEQMHAFSCCFSSKIVSFSLFLVLSSLSEPSSDGFFTPITETIRFGSRK